MTGEGRAPEFYELDPKRLNDGLEEILGRFDA